MKHFKKDIVFFITFFIFINPVLCSVLKKHDLQTLIESLGVLVMECRAMDTSIFYVFGLFLAKVNLKKALSDASGSLDDAYVDQMKAIIYAIDNIYERLEKQQLQSELDETAMFLSKNDTRWQMYLSDFYQNDGPFQHLYFPWKYYKKRVYQYERGVPNPYQSDKCMMSLAENQLTEVERDGEYFLRCPITANLCPEILLFGSNFGYFLSHRILLLLNANAGRGCHYFSPRDDSALIDKLCDIMIEEANFISHHTYYTMDLLMEQVSLCSITGNSAFVRRDWLFKLIDLQGTSGCFYSRQSTHKRTTFRLHRNDDTDTMTQGYLHLSSVAAGALASGIRFILQKYYSD